MRTAFRSAPIPTASVADIAFLLLVFFLIAAAIRSDAGLPVTLPPLATSPPGSVPALLAVLVNEDGALLVDGTPTEMADLRAEVASFAQSAGDPHVALQTAARTPYDTYIATLDAVLLGHRDAGVKPHLTLREPVRAP